MTQSMKPKSARSAEWMALLRAAGELCKALLCMLQFRALFGDDFAQHSLAGHHHGMLGRPPGSS